MKNASLLILFFLCGAWAAETPYYYHDGAKVALTPVSDTKSRSNADEIDYYKDAGGHTLGIGRRLIVRMKAGEPGEVASRYGLSVESALGGGLWLLKAQNPKACLNAANRLTSEPDIVFAHPDFHLQVRKR